MSSLPDLDNPQNIDVFVEFFYDKLLSDDLMAPLFLRDAQIEVSSHLATISLYWQKMLWGDKEYATNMMQKHRAIHAKTGFTVTHYQRWLGHFEQTAADNFSGEYTDKALRIANAVIGNMAKRMTAVA